MITLITGVPGSGKSLYATSLILGWLKQNEQYEKAGEHDKVRQIFVDIDGFDHETLGTKPMPTSMDWRETPDGSICVYDECQQHFGPDKSGRSGDARISSLEVHRHTGHDVVFITQRERLLHSHIRDLVGKHYHIQRVMGSHNVKIYSRDETIDTKSTSCLNSQCDQMVWRYPKELFKCYKSATVHTHSLKVPMWLKASICVGLTAIVFVVFMAYNATGFFTGSNVKEIQETVSPGSISSSKHVSSRVNEYRSELTSSIRPTEAYQLNLSGCVVWNDETECECLDSKGYSVEYLSFSQCMKYATGLTNAFRKTETETRKSKKSEDQML